MSKQRRNQRKVRHTRLYTDFKKGLYDTVAFVDGAGLIPVNIQMEKEWHAHCRQGVPFECVLARGIQAFADANPDAFPHPVLYVYVTRTAAYIVDGIKNGKMAHAHRYMHSFSKFVGTFDRITPDRFIARYDGVGLNLNLRPGRVARKGVSSEGGHGSGGSRTHRMARGAMERAIAAGIIPAPAASAA